VLAKLCQELAKLALHNISSSASKSAERAARFSLSLSNLFHSLSHAMQIKQRDKPLFQHGEKKGNRAHGAKTKRACQPVHP
jgi:hypothetical protein